MPSEAGRRGPPGPAGDPVRIGVLAEQGGFGAHLEHVASVGAIGVEVRSPADLASIDGLIIPGGESTTISMAMERDQLGEGIASLHSEGRPILGTCAGMILLGRDHLGLLDATVRRNAFGRQLSSFEEDLDLTGLVEGGPFPGIFIRAPWIERAGEEVEVLASIDGRPVAVRQEGLLALSFHPELSDDDRIHASFARSCGERRASGDR